MVSRSQHGWNLGEFDIWCKMTNFELGTRVPLIISAPWLTASKGRRSMALAEAVDLYPTLSELAMGAGQLPTGKAGEYLGGASLAPIFSRNSRLDLPTLDTRAKVSLPWANSQSWGPSSGGSP